MSSKKKPDRIWIFIDLINSKAFNSLTGYAPQLVIHVLKKRKFENHKSNSKQKRNDHWICVNSDSLNLTYIEFANSFNVSQKRMSKAIDQLLARGFIKIIHQGGGFRKDKSIYALSDNWMLWHKGVVFESRNKETIQRGFCKPKIKE